MDSIEINCRGEFRALVQQSFARADTALVLAAHECVVERLGADQAEQIGAADLLLRHHAEPIVVAAALLVPLPQCGCIEPDELGSLFGQDTVNLVERTLREDDFPADTDARHKEHLRLFPESGAEDPRIAILRIGLCLAELEKPADQNDDGRHDMAQEALGLYVPLADQMGMREFCMRLEDVCFRVLEPSVYEELARNVEPIQREDATSLKLLEEGVRRLLEHIGGGMLYITRTFAHAFSAHSGHL
jgi:(p)ppGpp synthase/HD superfamily hydrolase